MERRNFLFTTLLTPWILSAIELEPLPPKLSISEALFINCLQRTQSLQLLTEYIILGLGSNYKNIQTKLPKDIKKYDERFNTLYNYFIKKLKDKTAIAKIKEAKTLWEENKKMLLATPSKENALKIQDNSKKIIDLLGAVKVLRPKKSFLAVAKTGHLCREPIFMANLYLMKVWGVNIPDYKKRMQRHISNFHTNIKFLEEYPKNTPKIKALIKETKNNFLFFEIMYKQHRTAIPTLISKKADNIFIHIRTIKRLYTKIL